MGFKSDKQRKGFFGNKGNNTKPSNIPMGNMPIPKSTSDCKLSTIKSREFKTIHSTKNKNVSKILKSGFITGKNKGILNGVFSFFEKDVPNLKRLEVKGETQLKLTIKENSNIYDNGSVSPINSIEGGGNKSYKCIYKEIQKKINATPRQILEDHKKRNMFQKELLKVYKKNKVDIVINGGEFIIINKKAIKKVEKR